MNFISQDYDHGIFLWWQVHFVYCTAGSILMATDKKNRYMATGDVDGVIKVWDISEYCVQAADDVITTAPRKYKGTQDWQDILLVLWFCVFYVTWHTFRILILCVSLLHDILSVLWFCVFPWDMTYFQYFDSVFQPWSASSRLTLTWSTRSRCVRETSGSWWSRPPQTVVWPCTTYSVTWLAYSDRWGSYYFTNFEYLTFLSLFLFL